MWLIGSGWDNWYWILSLSGWHLLVVTNLWCNIHPIGERFSCFFLPLGIEKWEVLPTRWQKKAWQFFPNRVYGLPFQYEISHGPLWIKTNLENSIGPKRLFRTSLHKIGSSLSLIWLDKPGIRGQISGDFIASTGLVRMDMTSHLLSSDWLTLEHSNQPELSIRKLIFIFASIW